MDSIRWKQLFPFRGSGRIYNLLSGLSILSTCENENRRYAIEALKKGAFDIFHPSFFDSYFLPYLNGKPYVVTVHDMTPEKFPQYFPKNNIQIQFKKKYLSQAAGIVAVSENTKKDIVEILRIPEERITVIHHGGPDVRAVTSPPIVQGCYFLYVGNRDDYKNFIQTLRDFAAVSEKMGNTKLVCTGKPLTSREQSLIKELGLRDRILQKYVSDDELHNLYTYAVAFIYPSLYEGFGMPILEAYSCGCPVMLNYRSCFPEIAGNAALYFNSDGICSDLPDKLVEMLQMSEGKRQELIKQGFERLKMFSWKESSMKLFHLYDTIKVTVFPFNF